jgi:hypothetical protein
MGQKRTDAVVVIPLGKKILVEIFFFFLLYVSFSFFSFLPSSSGNRETEEQL